MSSQPVLDEFIQLYQTLNAEVLSRANSLDLLARVYDEKIEFIDPFHRIQGIKTLHQYFVDLYENVTHIDFVFAEPVCQDAAVFIPWEMTYQHPKLKSSQPISVAGGTHLIISNDRIIHHQDYMDAGAMLYEHVPVLGWAISKLKERMQ